MGCEKQESLGEMAFWLPGRRVSWELLAASPQGFITLSGLKHPQMLTWPLGAAPGAFHGALERPGFSPSSVTSSIILLGLSFPI